MKNTINMYLFPSNTHIAVEVPEPTRVMLPSNTPQGTPAPAILENSLRVTLQGFTSATVRIGLIIIMITVDFQLFFSPLYIV